MDKTIFSPFFPFWRSFFFPIYFASCSFPVLKCCFLIIHVFSFFCIFSSLKIIWTSYRGQHNTTTTPTPTPTPTPAPTPLPLPPFCTTLVVPVANDIAYSITVVYRYSSQDARGTDRPVLIWYAFHWLFKHALATQAASDLRLCLRLFFSQAST